MTQDPETYLSRLNQQQREAVEYLDGPQLVIAGAGSGKTRVITYKILHLLEMGVPPWRILALTFTNKAAREMRERIEGMLGKVTSVMYGIGTFHSIFSRILRAHAPLLGFKPTFTIYDAADSRNLVKNIIKELGLDDKQYKPATVLGEISNAKNALISPDDYARSRGLMEADAKNGRPKVAHIYRLYAERCAIADAMDFDDLLFFTNRLFDEHPEVAEMYQERFMYVLVDEYQDTNACQHRIVEKLVRKHKRLCVVGDDAQSIYSFRGANIGNILHLREDFPELRTFKLERNYRSTQNIINAAGSLIARNREQIPKNVYSENSKGERVDVVKCFSDMEESYKVAARLSQQRVSTGDAFNDFAILYRTNAQSRVLEEALRKRNIPYRIYGGLSFYQRKEVKDALAYFRLAVNPDDDEALRRVINYPARGIGDTTVQRLQSAAMRNNRSLWYVLTTPEMIPAEVKGAARKKLGEFAMLIERFIDMDDERVPADVLAYNILKDTGMATMYDSDTTPENISKKENLNELLGAVRAFVEETRETSGTDDPSLLTMSGFLTTVSLSTDQDSDDTGSEDRVTLMTVHSAKGLEFNNVFIVGVEDGLFPSSMAQGSQAEIEEERRLLYVAITRARNYCMMSYATQRFRNGNFMSTFISPFLKEIDRKYLNAGGTDVSAPMSRPVRETRYDFGRSMVGTARSLSDIRGNRPAPAAAPTSAVPDAGFVQHTSDEVSPGTRIHHPRFGTGTVTEVLTDGVGPRMLVEFDNDDTPQRVLLFKYAKFAIV